MADALKGLKQYEDAITHYREVAASPKFAAIGQNGWLACLAALSRWERVLELLALWDIPATQRLRWQAKAQVALNSDDEALETIQKWLQSEPDLAEALWLLTDIEVRRDGLETVLKRYSRLAKITSRPPVYKEIYASLCRRAGQPERALKTYEKINQGTANPWIQRKQAFALAKSGREKEAIPMMEELLKDTPTDFYLNSGYQGACRRDGQLNRAGEFYDGQLKRHPQEKALYGWIKRVKKS